MRWWKGPRLYGVQPRVISGRFGSGAQGATRLHGLQPAMGVAARIHPVGRHALLGGCRRRPPPRPVGLADRRRPMPRADAQGAHLWRALCAGAECGRPELRDEASSAELRRDQPRFGLKPTTLLARLRHRNRPRSGEIRPELTPSRACRRAGAPRTVPPRAFLPRACATRARSTARRCAQGLLGTSGRTLIGTHSRGTTMSPRGWCSWGRALRASTAPSCCPTATARG